MDIFYSVWVGRVIFILGILNIVMALLVFGTCRCVSGGRLLSRLMKYSIHKRIFGYHCHFWKVFWPSIIIHAFFALVYFGWPG